MTTLQGLLSYGNSDVNIGTLYMWAGMARRKEDYSFGKNDSDFAYYCGLRRGYETVIRSLNMYDDYISWYELNKEEL